MHQKSKESSCSFPRLFAFLFFFANISGDESVALFGGQRVQFIKEKEKEREIRDNIARKAVTAVALFICHHARPAVFDIGIENILLPQSGFFIFFPFVYFEVFLQEVIK